MIHLCLPFVFLLVQRDGLPSRAAAVLRLLAACLDRGLAGRARLFLPFLGGWTGQKPVPPQTPKTQTRADSRGRASANLGRSLGSTHTVVVTILVQPEREGIALLLLLRETT